MKRTKQKPLQMLPQPEYVIVLHPESDIYKELIGGTLTDERRDLLLSGARLLKGEAIRFTECRFVTTK